jgi:hypothetical protein
VIDLFWPAVAWLVFATAVYVVSVVWVRKG